MKNLNLLFTNKIFSNLKILLVIILTLNLASCEENDLPEIGSIADLTPPSALFSANQGEGDADEWKMYSFSNQSSSATSYSWSFGNGESSTDFEPSVTYPGEGTFTVTLSAKDNLGEESVYSEIVEVVEPPTPVTPDPILVNSVFDKLPKSSGSDCSCSGWINKSLGDQGESSSGNDSDVLKFDNNEPDHIYQEFEVVPNADYTIEIITQFKSLENNTPPMDSMLETRVLAGSGYVSGYSPTYYTETTDFPQDDFGYTSVSQVEDAANNLLVEVRSNPGDDSYITTTYTFNAGNNDSVALFMRGIGGSTSGNFNYNSGDEEIRLDSVTITAN